MADKTGSLKKRNLRVVKWLSMTPAVAVCTLCSREFKASMNALRRTADAQASLQQQFDTHKFQSDASRAETQIPQSHGKTKIET